MLADGSQIPVVGNEVVRKDAEGIPSPWALGGFRLYLVDAYALHGTNAPSSGLRAVRHGWVRLRNLDIAALYQMMDLATPVYIY